MSAASHIITSGGLIPTAFIGAIREREVEPGSFAVGCTASVLWAEAPKNPAALEETIAPPRFRLNDHDPGARPLAGIGDDEVERGGETARSAPRPAQPEPGRFPKAGGLAILFPSDEVVEHCLHPQRIGHELVVKLGQVLQCERSTEATLSDSGEDLLEIEDALRTSQRQMLLSCLRPSI